MLLPLHPALIVVGENFRFGHRAAGNVQTLRELGQGRFEVEGLRLVRFGDEETCSTVIRQALADGDVAHAAKHLGRPFRFSGLVAHGDHRGRELGFPTANLPVPQLLACPADGVYAGWLTRLDGRGAHGEPLPSGAEPEPWPAAVSVGTNPTFDDVPEGQVEAHVIDQSGLDLYGHDVTVEFAHHLRGMTAFTGIEALKESIAADIVQARALLAADAAS